MRQQCGFDATKAASQLQQNRFVPKSAMLLYHGGTHGEVHVQQQPERRPLPSNQNDVNDMRNAPSITSRLLIVGALALPVFMGIDGCKSTTTTQAVTTPGQTATDDAALAARVKQALVAAPGLKSLPMSVATYRGVVQLSGYVDSEAQIQQALAVTRSVPGVQSVSNDLHVRPQ